MPGLSLDIAEGGELAEMLQFLGRSFAADHGHQAISLAEVIESLLST